MRDAGGGRLTTALVLLVAFVIGGCDDSGPGSPTGPTSEPPVGGDPQPTSTAPRVTGTTPPK